jgi:hypothetical protein
VNFDWQHLQHNIVALTVSVRPGRAKLQAPPRHSAVQNRLDVDDSVIRGILRHSNVAVTRDCYIKTASEDAIRDQGGLTVVANFRQRRRF